MRTRTIQSPGVEINEIDLTTRNVVNDGPGIFITGYANQGPTDEIVELDSFSEFEELYGKPTNSAERYFYHTVKSSFVENARVTVSRIPYGAGSGTSEKYTALVYPVVSPNTLSISSITNGGASFVLDGDTTTAGSGTVYLNLVTKDSNDILTTLNISVSVSDISAGVVNMASSELSAVSSQTIVESFVYSTLLTSASGYASSLSASNYYVLGAPTLIELNQSQYTKIKTGEGITWSDAANNGSISFDNTAASLGKAGLIILNKAKSIINNNFEGYYVGIADNSNFDPSTNYDALRTTYSLTTSGNKTPGNYTSIPTSRLDFSLSATSDSNLESLGRSIEELAPFDINGAEFDDIVTLGIFKFRTTPFSKDTVNLSYIAAEGYTGSFNSFKKIQNQLGGAAKSFYLPDLDNNSPNIELFINPYISRYSGDWTSTNANVPTKKIRTLRTDSFKDKIHEGFYNNMLTSVTNFNQTPGVFALGTYKPVKNTNKTIGNVLTKLDRVFQLANNVDLVDIDIVPEGGIGTIYVANQKAGTDYYEETDYLDIGNSTSGTGFYTTQSNMIGAAAFKTMRDNYRNVFNKFEEFARITRKDCVFIADPLKHIFVQGEDTKVLDDKDKSFSQHVYWPLRHQFDFVDSSYAITYGTWGKAYDEQCGKYVWVPFSGSATRMYIKSDNAYAPWIAPAGYKRGIIDSIIDVSINPTQRQRDQMYKLSINPVIQQPNEGIVTFGQKTMLKRPSAFDRINVRRLFLDLEKKTREVLKYFVFEPNTVITRTRVVNTLTPFFENAKQTEGLYDYLIICNENNNQISTIENNELHVDIYIKPTRAAEFIIANFYAVNQDVDFNELSS